MSASCEHCESPSAALRCPQCAATLCDSCSAVIHAEGRFRQHTPGPVGETADIPRKVRPTAGSAPPAGPPPVVQQQQQQQPTLSPMPVNQMFPGQSFAVRRGPVKDDMIKVVPSFAKPQEVRRAKQCERCEEAAATVTCKECDSDYCATCTQLVHGEGKFAQHTVGPVTASPAPTVSATTTSTSSSSKSPVRAPARASPLSPEPAASWGSVKGAKRASAATTDSDSEDDFLEKPASPVFGCGRECKHDHQHQPQQTSSPTRVPPTATAPTPQLPKNRPVADDSDSEDDEPGTRSAAAAAELVAKIRSKQEMMQTKRLAYHEERKQRLRDSADTLLNKLIEGSSRHWTDTQLDVLRQAGPIQLSGCAEKVAHGVAIDIALTQLYAAQLRRLQSRESGPTPKDVLGKQYADLQRCVTDLNKLLPSGGR